MSSSGLHDAHHTRRAHQIFIIINSKCRKSWRKMFFCKRLPSHTGQEQACSRITWLFVRSSPCRKWPNTQENGCWLPPSDHIQSETLFQTRQDQEKGINGSASLLHSWRWVLFVNLIWLTYWCFVDRWNRDSFRQDLQAWLLFRQVWQWGHRCEMWLICGQSVDLPDRSQMQRTWKLIGRYWKQKRIGSTKTTTTPQVVLPQSHQCTRNFGEGTEVFRIYS